MALKGVKGPDRVLYGLAALLQDKLPGLIAAYNETEKARLLLVFPGGSIQFESSYYFKYEIAGDRTTIEFSAGTYHLGDIVSLINTAGGSMRAHPFSDFGIILECNKSFKVLTAFGNLRAGQICNNMGIEAPNTYIISGTVPGEDQIKAFPACLINLVNISPRNDGYMVDYGVDITLAATSPISSSQADYLSAQLMKYYDCIREAITNDDGSLGGLTNGVTIDNAGIDDATGNYNYLKLLTISLTIAVEED